MCAIEALIKGAKGFTTIIKKKKAKPTSQEIDIGNTNTHILDKF